MKTFALCITGLLNVLTRTVLGFISLTSAHTHSCYKLRLVLVLPCAVIFLAMFFVLPGVSAAATVTVSGTVYDYDGVTTVGSGVAVRVVVGTSTTPTAYTTTTDSNGDWSTSNITDVGFTSTTSIVAYINGTANDGATYIMVPKTATNLDIPIYYGQVSLAHKNTNYSPGIEHLMFYDYSDDPDIPFQTDGLRATSTLGFRLLENTFTLPPYMVFSDDIDVDGFLIGGGTTATFINPSVITGSLLASSSEHFGFARMVISSDVVLSPGSSLSVADMVIEDTGSLIASSTASLASDVYLGNLTINNDGVSEEGYYVASSTHFLGRGTYDIDAYRMGSFSVSGQELNPNDLEFSPDGMNLYVMGQAGDDINRYVMTTPWDISTASFDSPTYSFAAQEGTPQGMAFKPDGTRFYIVGTGNDTVYEYWMSTAWDVTTATYKRSYSVAARDNTPNGVTFNPSGTTMYIIGAQNDAVYTFSLSRAWDVTSATYSSQLSVSTRDANPSGLSFAHDGTKLFIVGQASDNLHAYSLSTPWLVSSQTYLGSRSIAAQDDVPQDVVFSGPGDRMFITGRTTDTVYTYDVMATSSLSGVYYLTNFGNVTYESGTTTIVSYDGSAIYSGDFLVSSGVSVQFDDTTFAVQGDYTALGKLTGTPVVGMTGTGAQRMSGLMTGTNSLYQLYLANEQGPGLSSPIYIEDDIEADVSVSVAASSTVAFGSGVTVTTPLFETYSLLHTLSPESPAWIVGSTTGSQWVLDAASSSVTYARVRDSNTVNAITCITCVDLGNNTNWTIGFASVDVSGTVYLDDGVTPAGAGAEVVAVNVNGVATTSTSAGGTFTLAVPVDSVSGYIDTVTLYINGSSTLQGAAIVAIEDGTGGVADADIVASQVSLRRLATSTAAITLANLAQFDGSDDPDIKFYASSTASTMLVSAGWDLVVATTTTATLSVASSTFSGSLINEGTIFFSDTNATTSFVGAGEVFIGDSASVPSLRNLVIHGTYTATGTLDADNVSIEAGGSFTYTGSADVQSSLTVRGNYSNNGSQSYASTSLVYLQGYTPRTVGGALTSANAFGRLTVFATSTNTDFLDDISTKALFEIVASSTVRFASSTTGTFASASWQGTAGSPIWVTSIVEGEEWFLDTDENFGTLSYVNVRDSNACANPVTLAIGDNLGNNTCWTFLDGSLILSGTLRNELGGAVAGAEIALVYQNSGEQVATTTSDGVGDYTFTVAVDSVASYRDVVTVYVNGSSTAQGASVYRIIGSPGGLIGADVALNELRVGAIGTTSLAVTLADLMDYDSTDDADLSFTAATSTGTFMLSDGWDFTILESGVFNSGASTTLTGNYTNSGIGRWVGTLRLSGSGKELAGALNGQSKLPNTVISGSYTMASSATTSALTISSGGSLVLTNNLSLEGALSVVGDLSTSTSHTITFDPVFTDLGNLYQIEDVTEFTSLSPADIEFNATHAPSATLDGAGSVLYAIGATADTLVQYNLSTAWSVASGTAAGSLSVAAQTGTPTGFTFSDSGLILFVLGSTGTIYEYSLSTAWDVTTATYETSYAVGGSGSGAIDFVDSGYRMYLVQNATFYAYNLDEPYNLATRALSASRELPPTTGNTRAITINDFAFSQNGEYMYTGGTYEYFEFIDYANESVNGLYYLGEAFNPLTSYSSIRETTYVCSSAGFAVNHQTGGYVRTCGNDILELVPTGASMLSSQAAMNLGNVSVRGSRTLFRAATTTNFTIEEGALLQHGGPALSVSDTLTVHGSIYATSSSVTLRGNAVHNLGTYTPNAVTVTGSSTIQGPLAIEGDLTIGSGASLRVQATSTSLLQGDITVAGVFDAASSSLTLAAAPSLVLSGLVQHATTSFSADDASPNDIYMTRDGTRLYMLGIGSDDVTMYILTEPWNIQSKVSSSTYSVAAQDTAASSLDFSQDGRYMYVLGTVSDTVYRYTLSTPWSISTASLSQSYGVGSYNTLPTGITFSSDGHRMYLYGQTDYKLLSFYLPTAWSLADVQTYDAGYWSGRTLSPGTTFAKDIMISDNGEYMHVLTSNESIFTYRLSTTGTIAGASSVSTSASISAYTQGTVASHIARGAGMRDLLVLSSGVLSDIRTITGTSTVSGSGHIKNASMTVDAAGTLFMESTASTTYVTVMPEATLAIDSTLAVEDRITNYGQITSTAGSEVQTGTSVVVSEYGGDASTTFATLRINSGATSLVGSALAVSELLSIESGATLTASGTLTLLGDYNNAGQFVAASSTVVFAGTGAQHATGTMTGTSAFADVRIENVSGSGAASTSVSFTAPLTVNGTLTMNASTSAAFLSGATTTVSVLNLLSSDLVQPVLLVGTEPGVEWYLVATGTTGIVHVKDSNACASPLTANGGTDLGNNTCWTFSDITFTISGVVYESNGVTPNAGTYTLKALVDSGSLSTASTTANIDGTFTLNVPVGSLEGLDYRAQIFIDNEPGVYGQYFTHATTSLAGVALLKDAFIVADDVGDGVTVAQLAFVDADDDASMVHRGSTTTSELLIAQAVEFVIATGTTLTTTGSSTYSGSFYNAGTYIGGTASSTFVGTGGRIGGVLTGTSTLDTLVVAGSVTLTDAASTTALTIGAGATLTLEDSLTTQRYTSNGTLVGGVHTLYLESPLPKALSEYPTAVAGFTRATTSVSAQSTNVNSVRLSSAGDRMYVSDLSSINAYSLSTPWDITTKTYLHELSTAQIGLSYGFSFGDGGSELYIADSIDDVIAQYSLTVPWDISTGSLTSTTSMTSYDTASKDVVLSSDGQYMFVLGDASDSIDQFVLATPWDISTLVYQTTKSVAEVGVPTAFQFSADGTRAYVFGTTDDDVMQYQLREPWLLRSMRPFNRYSVPTTVDATPEFVYFSETNNTFYVAANTNNFITSLEMDAGFDFFGSPDERVVNTATLVAIQTGHTYSADGRRMYITTGSSASVYEYSLTAPFDVAEPEYVRSFSVSAQETNPTGVAFNPTGTKMYVIGSGSDFVREYTLSTPWNISTASYSTGLSVTAQDTVPVDFDFSPDGQYLYTLGDTNNRISRYTLTTPYLVSSGGSVQNFALSDPGTSYVYSGIDVADDGASLLLTTNYTLQNGMSSLVEYDFGTLWDVTTLSLGTSRDGLYFATDVYRSDTNGFLSLVLDGNSDSVVTYQKSAQHTGTLSGAGALGTVQTVSGLHAFNSNVEVGNLTVASSSIITLGSNTMTASGNVTLHGQISGTATTSLVLTGSSKTLTGSMTGDDALASLEITGAYQNTNPLEVEGMLAIGDGSNLGLANSLTIQSQVNNLGTLDTNGFTTTLGSSEQDNQVFVETGVKSVRGSLTSAAGVTFKDDGTKMYVIDAGFDSIDEYALSSAWDVMSASYTDTVSVSTQETNPLELTFSSDGSKLYVIGSTGDDINEYALSVAWDASSATFTDTFSVASQDTEPTGLAFSADGLRLFVLGDTGNDVNEYKLTTAWDVSTGSYVRNYAISTRNVTSSGMAFSADGLKFYVTGTGATLTYEQLDVYYLSTPWSLVGAALAHTVHLGTGSITPVGIALGTNQAFVVDQLGLVTAYDVVQQDDVLLRGTFTGTSAFGPLELPAGATTVLTAPVEATDITVVAGHQTDFGTSTVTINGDYTVNGYARMASSTVVFEGGIQQIVTGTTTDAESFGDLTVSNTWGTGATSSVVFVNPLEVTGTFTAMASSSIAFSANATTTAADVLWVGTATSPVWLQSTASGTPWYLDITGTDTVSQVVVQDSNATSTSGGVQAYSSVDRGNNTNWEFLTGETGSLQIANHTEGQVPNAFTADSATDASLFRFRLIPVDEGSSITSVVVSVVGATRFDSDSLTSIRLFEDTNSDGSYNVGDTLRSNGALSVTGKTGTLSFTTTFTVSTSTDYVVVANWPAPLNGSFVTLDLRRINIDATGLQSNSSLAVSGAITLVQHSRNNKGGGGGGGSGSVGGDAPAGQGTQTGGGAGGGTDTDTNTGGSTIGSETSFFKPGAASGSWNSGPNAYDDTNGTYATTSSANTHTYNNNNFGIPVSNQINGIAVKLEIAGTIAGGTVDVQLSWDGGASWTTAKTTPTLQNTDTVYTLGGASDLWGRSWAVGQFSNENFRVRLTGAPNNNTIKLDAIQVRVYNQSTGGGGGGGAGEI